MPQMPPVPLQPPVEGGALRRFADQVQRHLFGVRETVNELAKFEHVERVIDSPSAVTYAWWLASSNRRVKAVQYGLRAGTCDVDILHGAFGSEAAISWLSAGGATISVSTTNGSDTPTDTAELIESGTWLVVTVSNVSGASGLAIVLELI